MKHKSIEIKADSIKEDGGFTGYASVFNVRDSYGDVVRAGAFARSIAEWKSKGRMPKLLWQHNPHEPIGVWEEIEEDAHGLKVRGRLLIDDVAKAREAYALIKNGAIDGLSIGYEVVRGEYNEEEEVFDLLEVEILETSIVTFPANDQATVAEVKSVLQRGKLPTLKAFEKFLRDAGFSKAQATAIASHGLRKLHQCDTDAVNLKEIINILKG